MKLTFSKKAIRTVLLILCAVMMENLFYLIDRESSILGILDYNYMWLIFFVAFIAYTYIQYGQWKSRETYYFGKEIALLACLVLVGAVRGCVTFNQSFLDGFIHQGCYFFIILSYYPIRKFYSRHIIDDQAIDKCLLFFGLIAFLLYFCQILLSGSITFLYVKTGTRYESTRLYVDSIFCVILGFYGMNCFLRTKRWKGLLLVAVTIAYELLISKGRLEFAAFCGSMAIGLILMKRYTLRKTLTLGLVVGLAVAFLNTQYASSLFEAVGNLANKTGTMSVRAYGRELYASRLLSSAGSLIFGCGYPGNESARIMSGNLDHVYLVDNGIFAFAYVYGIVGLIAVIIWFIKMLWLAWRLYKEKNEYIYLMFIVFNIALMYNITFWWWKFAWTLVTVIMMCKMEYSIRGMQ